MPKEYFGALNKNESQCTEDKRIARKEGLRTSVGLIKRLSLWKNKEDTEQILLQLSPSGFIDLERRTELPCDVREGCDEELEEMVVRLKLLIEFIKPLVENYDFSSLYPVFKHSMHHCGKTNQLCEKNYSRCKIKPLLLNDRNFDNQCLLESKRNLLHYCNSGSLLRRSKNRTSTNTAEPCSPEPHSSEVFPLVTSGTEVKAEQAIKKLTNLSPFATFFDVALSYFPFSMLCNPSSQKSKAD